MRIYKTDAGRDAIHALYRRALQRWPVPHEELTLRTCHGDTFVIASGDAAAPPLVLFHGSGANSSTWIGDVAPLGRSHRVYAVDMIGEPGLSAEARPPLASDAYARWLDDVWDGLHLEAASIVGLSLGGWLAITGSDELPKEVTEFVLAIFSHFRPRMERLPLRTDEELTGLAMPVQLVLGATDRIIQSADTRQRMERAVKDLHLTWLENDAICSAARRR